MSQEQADRITDLERQLAEAHTALIDMAKASIEWTREAGKRVSAVLQEVKRPESIPRGTVTQTPWEARQEHAPKPVRPLAEPDFSRKPTA